MRLTPLLFLILTLLACALPTAVVAPPTPTPIPLPTTAVLAPPIPTAGTTETEPPPTTSPPSEAEAVQENQPLRGSALPLPSLPPRSSPPYVLPQVELPPGQLRATIDPTAVGNPADLPLLSDAERAQFEREGWVILPDPYASPYDIYAQAQAAGQPLFITQDLLLLATQTIHQEVINEARTLYLPFYLRQLTAELTAVSATQLAQLAPNDPLAEAARRNLAYATLAGLFLEPTYPIPPSVTDLVESELTLAQQAGTFNSPLFGRVMDYTSLATAVSPLERTLLWYRHYGWSLSLPPEGEELDPAQQRLQARQIQLWLAALEPVPRETHPAWRQVAEPLAYLEGASGTPMAHWSALYLLTDDTPQPVDDFIETAQQLAEPTFTLLPPPLSAHGRVMHHLSYNRVGGYTGTNPSQPPFAAGDTAVGLVRLFPHSWDIAAAAGSDEVLRQLQTSGETSFEGYNLQLSTLREDLLPAIAAAQNYELAWWHTLAALIPAPDPQAEGAEAARATHQLSRWQLGWLFSQSNVIPPPFPPRAWDSSARQSEAMFYLDPQPELYARLGAQTNQLLVGLGEAGWLSEPAAGRLQELGAILLVAQATAVRQEAGQTLGELEQQFLSELLARLHAITGDPALPYTAVVHTDPTTGQAVTLHVPSAYPLILLAYHNGQPLLFTGATLLIEERK